MLTLPLAGCTSGGDSGKAFDPNAEQQIEMQSDEKENCTDEKCPDGKNGECPDGKCDDGNCDGDKCPVRPIQPSGRHRNGRKMPLPAPHKG